MSVIHNVKYHYAIPLKFGDKSLPSLTKLVLKVKPSICSTIKKSAFVLSQVLDIFCRCHNLIYFYSKGCVTKKHGF